MPETLDPRSTLGPASGPEDLLVFVEVLFHPDLRRIGDLLVMGPASRAQRVEALGRDEPVFARDGELRGLGDPCVSRRQLSIAWSPAARSFAVAALPDARRPLTCFDERGAPSEAPLAALPEGTLVAIGDRVLLRLGCGPLHLAVEAGAPLGQSAAAIALRQQVALLARSELPVLIRGETGVGKELVARALHGRSARHARPLLAINCAALPELLVESELFGHARGAFSGATGPREGLFRAAEGGTLLLDEIGELPLAVQAKLLRVLQERTIRPLGEPREVAIDVRLLAATHRPLEDDVAAGRFRADLYARIEAPAIVVPPLRARRLDVPRLFAHFVMRAREGGDDLMAATVDKLVQPADTRAPRVPMAFMLEMLRHDWPRNVRELEKVALAALIGAARTGSVTPPWPISAGVTAPALPAAPANTPERRTPVPAAPAKVTSRPTREALLAALEAQDYVQARVATELDVSRTTLDKWMREHAIRRPKDVGDAELAQALEKAGGDHAEAARVLGISERGLRLRLTGGGGAK